MEFVTVTQTNIHLLKDFINNLGTASVSFRYFNSRTTEVIYNHLTTLVIIEETKPIAYGHLDVENEIVWLGICVLPGFQSKGYGKLIMTKLINIANQHHVSKINLTVDKINKSAINLYEQFHFLKESEYESCYKYSLQF